MLIVLAIIICEASLYASFPCMFIESAFTCGSVTIEDVSAKILGLSC